MPEDKKADRERQIFLAFARMSGLPIDLESAESRKPPEPDIICYCPDIGHLYFELVELAEVEIKQKFGRFGEQLGDYIRINSNVRETLKKKASRRYKADYPIDLLCYAVGSVRPDDALIEDIRLWLGSDRGQFCRVWFFGETGATLVFADSSE